ncbi:MULTISPECIES: iron-containing alcohol dehydrogenase [unclassified Candidatus Frackibacter]|uniref:iron-containing alcohol dehydrogenase n=1 Tax=unclassified Candidatus Frackibacter TaxID=2648818 RepID=UPI0008909206|nr:MULTISPECIES: iron-containing alcohol dehydrogenase [unclassified Candidatus Frackibacter]SDC47089.1 Alcohol dehydrogenase, class IV [Candidatus Frackibacter sp. WG11]SEM81533.1 Alcohol dehydrogenase, class IV [Candidatus Frackibacter sp. WG12]SFL72494.1 Alcohol dehydrogenase, class IV [Candidatus Frackibacter sp. WG13]
MTTFAIPRTVHHGKNSLKELENLEGNKAIIVTDEGTMSKLGFVDKVRKHLKNAGLEVKVFEGVEPDPSVKTVKEGKDIMLDFGPDWIIALGGGSPMDGAKVMWSFYEHPDLKFEDIIEVNSMPKLRNKARFVAIPSTSGTASEITAFAVITDREKKIKYPLVSGEIIPDIAIVDPEIPSTMPKHITANTGMDVLTHAVEAYISTAATDYTDALALKAIDSVFEYLPTAYENGDDLAAREKMHDASTMAGMAFSNASLGIVHSLAHKIGGELHFTHGLSNAILLPYVIEFNYEAAEDKLQKIQDTLGIGCLAEEVHKLNNKVGIPDNFQAIADKFDVTDEMFEDALSRMPENSHKDPCTLTNPNEPTVEDMKVLYEKAYYGK